jgi:hypothetical protein
MGAAVFGAVVSAMDAKEKALAPAALSRGEGEVVAFQG